MRKMGVKDEPKPRAEGERLEEISSLEKWFNEILSQATVSPGRTTWGHVGRAIRLRAGLETPPGTVDEIQAAAERRGETTAAFKDFIAAYLKCKELGIKYKNPLLM